MHLIVHWLSSMVAVGSPIGQPTLEVKSRIWTVFLTPVVRDMISEPVE
jgi:hypothetical protein